MISRVPFGYNLWEHRNCQENSGIVTIVNEQLAPEAATNAFFTINEYNNLATQTGQKLGSLFAALTSRQLFKSIIVHALRDDSFHK